MWYSVEVDGLGLEGLHEALCLGVVVGIAAPAHRADEAVRGEQRAVRPGGVLQAAVGVEDAARGRAAKRDRPLEGGDAVPGLEVAGEGVGR